ncbi:ABC transporter permease subunit [Paenibacillus sepulcri]|uniref:ABC transporter permease subunit n=2 Tax=Paenibacillus sepulcri TaxID=359917 RepID=A0ABS7C6B4_9BACL|nr:ABC transporter permease subunit [Paenibacillus sepulcri]
MYGAQIAFKDFSVSKGIMGSEWVGFAHFKEFFHSYEFTRILKNTVGLSLYTLLAGFPLPIIFALSLNYVGNRSFKKSVQMITFAPYFISVVVLIGIMLQFLAPRTGIINIIIGWFGGDAINFMGTPGYFKTIYVASDIWQTIGFNCIIYIAALTGIDPSQHEAGIVDGATKLQRIWYIDLPGILPIAITLFILNTGHVLDVGFEKVLLMQNPLNMRTSEVIDTYVYKQGLTSMVPNYDYSTAIGLFKSFIGLVLLLTVNKIAKKVGQTSLW